MKADDEDLYAHLVSVTQKNLSFDPREFLVNFIHTEKEKAQLVERELRGGGLDTLASDARELLSHPIIFIRKWLAEVHLCCYIVVREGPLNNYNYD